MLIVKHSSALASLLVLLSAGCVLNLDPEEGFIAVSAIEVDDFEGNGTANMEVEAHLYDLATDSLLGCARLDDVDQGFVSYRVREYFALAGAPPGSFLRVVDVEDLDVYLWVVEKDTPGCPSPFDNVEDDIIGRTLPFRGVELSSAQVMEFERVTSIELGALPTDSPR